MATSAPKEQPTSAAIDTDWLYLALNAGKSVGWDWDVRSGRDSWFGDLQTMFGIRSQDYTGDVEDFRRRVHPEDRGSVWKAVQAAMQSKQLYVAQFRIVKPDGTIRWVAAQGKFYYSSNGEPERMLGIAVDITERKGAEEALHQKEIELREAQRLAGVGSWQWDSEHDVAVWSDELYRIYGRDPKLPPLRDNELSQFYSPESCARLRHAVEETLRTGAQFELDVEMIRADGTTKWLTVRGESQRDAAGRSVGLRGTVHDITERRRSEHALRENEQRLRLAAQAGRMYAFEWDRASDLIVRSAEFAHILGLTSEPIATTCQEMLLTVHPDDRAGVIAATNRCTPENPTCKVQYRVLRPDGSVIWMEKIGHAFFEKNGSMVRMVGMVADITERKLAEEALSNMSRRLLEVQEAERARIARELHDDIGQQVALLWITLEHTKQVARKTDYKVRERLDELSKQISRLSGSVQSLSHELHSPSLRFVGVANAMRGCCAELSKQHKVEINFTYKDVPDNVSQEISLCLFRVLQEALHNAVRHSGVHHFDVELRGTLDALYLTVRDSGLGFDLEAALRGRGLGLSSMQERLKLVHGELSIESRPAHGTTIRARVPLNLGSPR
jgi:PAS domain S-box-containing protein